MTTAKTKTKLQLPKKWRETLALRVDQLQVPELNDAFNVAEAILQGRSESEVQKMVEVLWQSIAPATEAKSAGGVPDLTTIALDPRLIYCLYANGSISTPPRSVSIMESLAVGTVAALGRACDAMDVAKTKVSWQEAARVLAAACAFGEWMYMASSFPDNPGALELFFPGQVRSAAKKKVSSKASSKSKQGWDKKLAPEKQKVYAAYEAGKPWPNVKAATDKIHGDQVTTAVMYEKLYKWLLKYEKRNPS